MASLARRVGRWAAPGLVFGAMSLGVVAPVAAQTADPGTYTGVTPPQVGSVQTGVAPVEVAFQGSQPSSLPFTGTDAVELATIGVVLIGGGVVLRVSARKRRA
ncbi:MAG TPA: hypothetical protein VHT75_05950 [Acidimicrobiales bacterium]|jgi:hypothetical protein|nr:hypothetical protein [Acidimicrobiales bacterium]